MRAKARRGEEGGGKGRGEGRGLVSPMEVHDVTVTNLLSVPPSLLRSFQVRRTPTNVLGLLSVYVAAGWQGARRDR